MEKVALPEPTGFDMPEWLVLSSGALRLEEYEPLRMPSISRHELDTEPGCKGN